MSPRLRMLVLLAAVHSANGAHTCGDLRNELFADMHDGDQKNVTLTEAGVLTLSQSKPVPWNVTTRIDLETCVATIDFSKSTKPARPPVPLLARVLQSTVGTLLLEFTDPSGTLSNRTQTLNLWTTEKALPAADACATFGATSFHDMHDGDVKTVAVSRVRQPWGAGQLVMTMGQAGVWNLTTTVDPKTCGATVDFSKTTKPQRPPVPLLATVAVASGNDGKGRVILTFTDPSATISASAGYPLNVWESA